MLVSTAIKTALAMTAMTVMTVGVGATASGAATPRLVAHNVTNGQRSEQTTPVAEPRRAFEPQSGDLVNSGRGMYEWLEQAPMVPGWRTTDVYWRDQLQWGGQLERSRGVYDFSVVEKGLSAAQAKGGRFSFRIMSLCPGCGGTLTPSYVPRQSNGAPDWNSEAFLSGWENMFLAMGNRYDKDPRMGVIDIGGYGLWGEWYCDSRCGGQITDENALRLARAVVTAFPSKFATVGYTDSYAAMIAEISPRIGLRFDCIGMGGLSLQYLPTVLKDVWKRAPVIGEMCPVAGSTAGKAVRDVKGVHVSALSSANFVTSYARLSSTNKSLIRTAYQISGFRYSISNHEAPNSAKGGESVKVSTTWSNTGVAPTYDPWRIQLRLLDTTGRTVASTPLNLDLRKLPPGSTTIQTTFNIPDKLRGTYQLAVTVTDPTGYLPAMRLGNHARNATGSYPLSPIHITETQTH